MISARRAPAFLLVPFVLLVLAGLASSYGCATTKQVQQIVSQSNAAMLDVPGLEVTADSSDPDKWKEAVARIDRLIEQNPSQTTLVATLRVRQAMLLTTYRQFVTATEAWGLVDSSGLVTDRDEALYDLHAHLVWWFQRAGESAFGTDDIERAERATSDFAERCDRLERGSGIRFYLETMRALIALKAANSVNTFDNEDLQQQVSQEMADAIERLASQYDQEDVDWILNASGSLTEQEMPLERLRARVWLRDLVLAYRGVARDKGLTPAWEPEWIGTIDL